MLGGMRTRSGFTLIEVMITVAVLGVLLAIGVPSLTNIIGNMAVRTNAEAINSAIQFARAEAIRRNAAVKIEMSAAGTSWRIRFVSDNSVLQERGEEGRANTVAVTFEPAAVRIITFGSLGTVTDATPITALKVDSVTLSAANSREMCVMLSVTGSSRVCDPQRATANLEAGGSTITTTDPQSCQPAVPAICTPTP